jgi:hypothetical protein
MAAIVPKIELELQGRGNGWTDVTADVLSPIRIQYGIQGGGPTDRTAGAGVCRFELNNSERNSGGRLGYYSPGNGNARVGFAIGIRVRVQFQDPATSSWHVKHLGSIVAVTPQPGAYGPRRVIVESADWFDEAARSTVAGLATQLNKRSDEIVSLLIGNVPRSPEAQSIATGADTYAYALDTARDDRANPVLQELARVTMSELGYLYQTGDGTVVFEARFDRANTTDAVTLQNDMSGLSVTSSRDELLTKVQVVTHPRTVDSAAVVLYRLQSVTEIPVDGTVTLLGPYTDPNNRASRVGGTDMVTPVATTDYLMNSLANGTGTDLTASMAVTASLGGNGVRWSITNNSGQVAYITKLQARGKGVYDFETTVAEAEDATLAADFGEQVAVIDLPYQSDPAVGQSTAEYLLGLYGPQEIGIWSLGTAGSSELGVTTQLSYFNRSSVGSVQVRPRTAALQTQILAREVGDRIALEETVTGLQASFYIQAVALEVVAPGIPSVTWTLAPADTQAYWALGETGYSELGNTTWLAFS